MECPNCENVLMQEATQDIPYTYKGKTTIIKNVSGELRQKCGEFILSREEPKRINTPLKEFVQSVNAADDRYPCYWLRYVESKIFTPRGDGT